MNTYTVTTKKTWSQTLGELEDEFKKWGVTEWDVNYPRGARLTGFNQSEQDRTVTLTYVKQGKTISLCMGKQNRAIDNLRVLYLAIEAMRMNEKRGVGEVLASAYLQIASPVQKRSPYEVLQISPSAPLSVAEMAYKALVKDAHPDAGGSNEKIKELNEAIAEIRKDKQGQ